jgi:hypothetical protein
MADMSPLKESHAAKLITLVVICLPFSFLLWIISGVIFMILSQVLGWFLNIDIEIKINPRH